MSANNFYFAKKIRRKWYGWNETAEKTMDDEENDDVRRLYLSQAKVVTSTLEALEEKLNDYGSGYSEYGLTTQPYLPKDGTLIEVVDDLEDEK